MYTCPHKHLHKFIPAQHLDTSRDTDTDPYTNMCPLLSHNVIST